LILTSGCNFKISADVTINIGYTSNTTALAIGTATAPIIFTSSAATPTSGDWLTIYFCSHLSTNTKFNYTEFKYGGKSDGILNITDCTLDLANCKVSNSKTFGIYTCNGSYTGTVTFDANEGGNTGGCK